MDFTEAPRILGVAPKTVRRLAERGTLPAIKIQDVAGYCFEREQVEVLIQPVVVNSGKKEKRRENTARTSPRSRSKRATR